MADELIKKVTEAMNDKRKVTVEKISEEEHYVTITGLEVKDNDNNLITNNSYIKYKVTIEYDGEDTLTFVKFLTPLKFIVDDKKYEIAINYLEQDCCAPGLEDGGDLIDYVSVEKDIAIVWFCTEEAYTNTKNIDTSDFDTDEFISYFEAQNSLRDF